MLGLSLDLLNDIWGYNSQNDVQYTSWFPFIDFVLSITFPILTDVFM